LCRQNDEDKDQSENKKTSASATPNIATPTATAAAAEIETTYSNLLFRLSCASMLLQSERGRLKRSLSWASLCAVVKTAQQEGGWST
jgi:hypothetical protein